MPYLLALDQGTTSSRAIVFESSGRIVHTAQKEFTQIYPQPGWVEHDPAEIWSSQLEVVVQAMTECGLPPRSVVAAGITNQRETTILWDRRTGEPVYNAIVWQDRRTAGYCDELRRAGAEPEVQSRTGLLLDPYFSGTKLRWILENVAGVRRRAEAGELAFGTVDTWLIWKLTGGAVHATDPSNASRTLLFNIHTGRWDEEMLRLLEHSATGPPGGAPVERIVRRVICAFIQPCLSQGVAGDQQAALFGQACFEPGVTKNTYGTGCFMLMQTGKEPVASKNRLLTTVAWETATLANMRSKAAYSSEEPWCSGCGMASRSFVLRPMSSNWPRR